MHRDVKIGLVLGVVLVAVIAALFFRREPVAEDGLVAAQDSLNPARSALDERVARAPAAPYLMPLEPLAEPEATPPPAPEPRRRTSETIASPADESQSVAVSPAEEPAGDRPQWKPIPVLRAEDHFARATEPGSNPPPTKSHRLERGDTLYGLAERYLGDGDQYRLLFEVNRAILAEPNRLPVGVEIAIPQSKDEPRVARFDGARKTTAENAVSESTPFQPKGERRPRHYTVARGDTLIKIARRVYGDGRHYRRIYQANRNRLRNPDRLTEDMVLEIP